MTEESSGHHRPLGPGVLTGALVVGLVGGWLARRGFEWSGRAAPLVTDTQVVGLVLVAALLAITAWVTHRVVRARRVDLGPRPAVNRLLLAQACALVGALVVGGYAGYGVSWLGHGSELAAERFWRAMAAAAAGGLVVAGALALEWACRVRPPDDDAGDDTQAP